MELAKDVASIAGDIVFVGVILWVWMDYRKKSKED